MKIWVDAHFSPSIAAWINREFDGIKAESVRAVGLQYAMDSEIFEQARKQNVVVMSKDDDFLQLIKQHGPPPKLIWVTCGNTSNAMMRELLQKTLYKAVQLLNSGDSVVEISDRSVS